MSGEAPEPAAALFDKARAVVSKVRGLKRDFVGAHDLAQRAVAREALTRTELTLALNESLSQRADLEARLRKRALDLQNAAFPRRLRRHNRLSQGLDRILARLGPWGQAAVVARSGVKAGGFEDGRVPALFDPDWYLAANPDVHGSGLSPLAHYLVAGGREGRSAGILFDDPYYRLRHAEELAATSLSSLEHYLRAGAGGADSPHPLFDTAHYLAQSPGLARGEDPVSHYIREGGPAGLSPHPLFDPAWYGCQASEAAGLPALLHYLSVGWRKDYSPHPLFDPAWYAGRWSDVAESGMPPLLHFLTLGGFEGRSPSGWFDLEYYVGQRGGDLPAGVNPLVDYLQGGAWLVNEARPGFPTAAYIAARPDLVRAGVTPLEHWARQMRR